MKYLRFGDIPENGKSINFLKLTNRQNEDFTDACKIGTYEDALQFVPEDAFECGVSVFEIDESGMPALDNLRLVSSMISRIDDKVYEVSGKQMGIGNDGEPLIKIEKIEKKRSINREKLISHAVSTLCRNFKSVKFNKNWDGMDCRLDSFCVENKINILSGEIVSIWTKTEGDEWVKMPPYTEYAFNGWTFSHPVEWFNANLGFQG